MGIKLKNLKIKWLISIVLILFIALTVLARVVLLEQLTNRKAYYQSQNFQDTFEGFVNDAFALNKGYREGKPYGIKNRVNGSPNFSYYILNVQTGVVATNLSGYNGVFKWDDGSEEEKLRTHNYLKERIRTLDYVVEFDQQEGYIGERPKWDPTRWEALCNDLTKGQDYAIYAGVKWYFQEGDAFYTGKQDFIQRTRVLIGIVNGLIITGSLALLLWITRGLINYRKMLMGVIGRIRACFDRRYLPGDLMVGAWLSLGMNMLILTQMQRRLDESIDAYYIVGWVWNGLVVGITYWCIRSMRQVMRGADRMAKGELDYHINTKSRGFLFKELGEALNHIGEGQQVAVKQAIKSEMMKTELITNVSHDLKTPLTAIVNYVGLLKQEKLENEKAAEYVAILDVRSRRLKQLIEDLIEASKAATGNLAVELETLELGQLVEQALGEYGDRMADIPLEVRMKQSEVPIKVMADGRHMWRLLENLLSNILKYSMPGSRVYIAISENEKWGTVTFKNMSKDPLEMEVADLTQRFVRGDMSRSTEGSGLGLSIAQSLAQLQGGGLELEVDGDLFKVIVRIPKVNNEKRL